MRLGLGVFIRPGLTAIIFAALRGLTDSVRQLRLDHFVCDAHTLGGHRTDPCAKAARRQVVMAATDAPKGTLRSNI